MLNYMHYFFISEKNSVTPIFIFFTFLTHVTHYLPEKKSINWKNFARTSSNMTLRV